MNNKRSIGLTCTRVIISLIIIKDLLIYFQSYRTLFGSNAISPLKLMKDIIHQYHLDFLSTIFESDIRIVVFLSLGLICATLLFLGIANKVSGLILFTVLLNIKFRNVFILDGGDNLILVILPLIALGKSKPLINLHWKSAFKTPAFFSHLDDALTSLMPLAIMIQVCILYFFAALSKMAGPLWQNGTAVYYVMRVEDFRWTQLNFLLTSNYIFVKSLTYLTIIWEALFPFLMLRKRIKFMTILMSICMHLGIFVFMHIDNYSFVMIATYFIFFTNHELQQITEKARLLLKRSVRSTNLDAPEMTHLNKLKNDF